jgi:protein disulfide-isomerase A6
MKPVWEELGSEYEASSSVLIGDVDCTVHSGVCGKHGVQGYPTIKYFTDGSREGTAYNGGRDKDSLTKFAKDTLEVKCLVNDPTGCNDKEVKFIESMKVKSADEVKAQVDRLTKMKDGKMKPELKGWLIQRLNILKQLSES